MYHYYYHRHHHHRKISRFLHKTHFAKILKNDDCGRLYQFIEIEDEDEAHRIVREMRDVMNKYDVRGNVRVAREGVTER